MSNEPDSLSQVQQAIDNYRYSVLAYRQFLDLVQPVMKGLPDRDEEYMSEATRTALSRYMRGASSEELAELTDVAEWFRERAEEIRRIEDATRDQTDLERGDKRAAMQKSVPGPSKSFSRSLSPRVAYALAQVARAIRAHVPADRHQDILYRGVLTGLVGQFEVLISDLVHHFYRRAPGALGSRDKVLTAGELLSFDNIEDAVEYVISDKVEDLLRGSADDWRQFFISRLNIELDDMSPDWRRFVEFIQRRHLIVHTGGRVSRRYLKNVDPMVLKEHLGDPQVGQAIALESDYIESALHSFEITGLLLGFSCWVKLHPDHSPEQSSLLDEIIYERMLANHWTVVLFLSTWGAKQTTFNDVSRTTFRVNSWLALKRLDRWPECSEEVETFDCSALRPVYAAVRAALLDDSDGFFMIVEENDGAGFDERAWNEWPILMEMRSDPRFDSCKSRYREQPIASHGRDVTSVASGDDARKPSGTERYSTSDDVVED